MKMMANAVKPMFPDADSGGSSSPGVGPPARPLPREGRSPNEIAPTAWRIEDKYLSLHTDSA